LAPAAEYRERAYANGMHDYETIVVGPNCGLCRDAQWTYKSKGL
jgi:hypothetical protein